MKNHWSASLVALLSCFFVVACGTSKGTGDGWKEYKYRSDGFAVSAPSKPIPLPPSDEHPNTRAYGLNYGNRTEVLIAAGTLGTWENLSDREKLQRLKDLEVQGTSSKLISDKEISLDGNPGIEYEIEGYVLHSRSRYFIVNDKIVLSSRLLPQARRSLSILTAFLIRCVC